ncbi:hypothetical protein BN940_01926 [Castellaniella defragrans 65Phen]|uniref:Uncharacterized protein n=1 Tax=Castellaniella defragrans (strain DSM 12143 / CCUG 39792 / 65Phen) TaxID=1437824 RepID=W8X1T4_CASD6|nr:hypothetical protein BN940_01926 [Castellaniella defragrans 65Phen]
MLKRSGRHGCNLWIPPCRGGAAVAQALQRGETADAARRALLDLAAIHRA